MTKCNSRDRRLILASTSRYRRAVLDRLGVPYEIRAPACDEAHDGDLTPYDVARILAERKAKSISQPETLVVGSDQVVDLDGEVLGKPMSAEGAVAQLERLAGRSHRLITAVAVWSADETRIEVDVDVHTLTMRVLSREVLQDYVAFDQPLDCAGAYKLERRGIALFERIVADPDMADDTAIVGLPLMKLCRLLRRFDFDVLTGS